VLLPKVPSSGRGSNSVKVFFNKSTKAMPYISKQYRTNSFVNSLRSYIAQVPLANTHDRMIDLAPFPKEIDEKGVVRFVENGRAEAEVMRKKVCKPDVLVLATGYTQSFPFLDSTYPTPNQANMRTVWKEGDSTVGFIGFLRPSFGKDRPPSL
jgi:dimethylaniline monooxygenase (N-oxide forming)